MAGTRSTTNSELNDAITLSVTPSDGGSVGINNPTPEHNLDVVAEQTGIRLGASGTPFYREICGTIVIERVGPGSGNGESRVGIIESGGNINWSALSTTPFQIISPPLGQGDGRGWYISGFTQNANTVSLTINYETDPLNQWNGTPNILTSIIGSQDLQPQSSAYYFQTYCNYGATTGTALDSPPFSSINLTCTYALGNRTFLNWSYTPTTNRPPEYWEEGAIIISFSAKEQVI